MSLPRGRSTGWADRCRISSVFLANSTPLGAISISKSKRLTQPPLPDGHSFRCSAYLQSSSARSFRNGYMPGLPGRETREPRAASQSVGRGSTQPRKRRSAQRWRAERAFSRPRASAAPALAWYSGSKPKWRESLRHFPLLSRAQMQLRAGPLLIEACVSCGTAFEFTTPSAARFHSEQRRYEHGHIGAFAGYVTFEQRNNGSAKS